MSQVVARRLIGASLACAAAFVLLATVVAVGGARLTSFDSQWSAHFYGFTDEHPAFESVMRLITALGGGLTVTLVTSAAVVWAATRREWVLAGWLVVVVSGSALMSTLIKVTVERARPGTEGELASAHGFSFPSGHTQAATVAYTAVVLVVAWQLLHPGPKVRLISVIAVTVVVGGVGLSRILLGVHWPTDVLGGWLFGSAWVTAATFLLLRYGLPQGQLVGSARWDPSPDACRDAAQ